MRQQVAYDVHGIDQKFAVLDADMDVRAEDEQALRQFLHILLYAGIAIHRRNILLHPRRDGMRAGCRDTQAILGGQFHNGPAQAYQFLSQFGGRLTDN